MSTGPAWADAQASWDDTAEPKGRPTIAEIERRIIADAMRAGEQRLTANDLEQRVRFLHPTPEHVHRVTEFTGRNPGLWLDGDDWGLTLRTTDGHDVELDSEVVVALAQALIENEPIECRRCARLADPDSGDDQTCTDHTPGRRYP